VITSNPTIPRLAALSAMAGLLVATSGCTEETRSIPSISQEVKKFQSQSKGYTISEADQRIMQQAAEDLARRMPNPGLKAGDKAPDFTLKNAHGKPITLSNHFSSGPVVLIFYRGAWCPFCNLQLKALQKSVPHFQREGARLIAVTPQKPDKSLQQVKKDGYPFEILSDLDGDVMRAYGLYFEVPPELSDVYKRNFKLDLAEYNGPGRYVLPVPGTFVIDTKGIMRAAYAHTNYTKRMEPTAIVAALKEINGK